MEKLDLAKTYKGYYSAKTKPEIVEIEKAQFLSVTGQGDPSGPDFAKSVQALYSAAYAVKFAYKAIKKDFVVPKLEGLWWFDDGKYADVTIDEAPVKIPRSEWNFTLMIRMPDYVTKEKIPAGSEVTLVEHTEGTCVQMLHVGPFSEEPKTLLTMMKFMTDAKMKKNGLHHEIYLSDFRKTSPDKLKTILREPVKIPKA